MRDPMRNAIHEAGHFLQAFRFRPTRAVSIRIGRSVGVDSETGEQYVAAGNATTFDYENSLPNVLIAIRAAGLAAESLVYREQFEDLMGNAEVLNRIKTDIDNAKNDLMKAGLLQDPDDASFSWMWRQGFVDAVTMLQNAQDTLRAIAKYALANGGRDISREELEQNIDLS